MVGVDMACVHTAALSGLELLTGSLLVNVVEGGQ